MGFLRARGRTDNPNGVLTVASNHPLEDALSEMFSRPTKKSHEGTIHYEARMLRLCAGRLRTLSRSNAPEEVIVHLECFLLHYRNLAQFLSGKGGTHGDLKITNWKKWARKQLTEEEVSIIAVRAAASYGNYCDDISTYLSHCTRQRYEKEKEWNTQKMLNDIEPAIRAFEKLFPPSEAQPRRVVNGTPDTLSTATLIRYGGSE